MLHITQYITDTKFQKELNIITIVTDLLFYKG